MSSEVEIKLTGGQFRELVKALEPLGTQAEAECKGIEERMREMQAPTRFGPIGTDGGDPTVEQIAEYDGLEARRGPLRAFLAAKRAFFS